MNVMTTYHTHFTGAYVAECPACHRVCAGWDDDDLNDNGQLECSCDATEYGSCDICDEPYLLGSDDHNTETGNHYECETAQ